MISIHGINAYYSVKQMKNIKFFDQLIVRTPAFPYKEDFSYADLLEILNNDYFKEAIYIASPSFCDEIYKWKQSPDCYSSKDKLRLLNTLYKYACRISQRATPYGTFSNIGLTIWADSNTKLAVTNAVRVTNLNIQSFFHLKKYYENIPFVQKELLYYPNNSLYVFNNKIKIIIINKTNFSHESITITNTEYITRVINNASLGKTIKQLAACIVDHEITEEDASEFIVDLIDKQVLVSELEICMTGEEPLINLRNTIKGKQNILKLKGEIQNLDWTVNYLDKLKGKEICDIENYKELEKHLDDKYSLDRKHRTSIFNTISYSEYNGSIDKNIQNILAEAIPILNKLSPEIEANDLYQFSKLFSEQYNEEEVALSVALDSDVGLGYPIQQYGLQSNLLKNLKVNQNKSNKNNLTLDTRSEYLLGKILEAYNNKEHTIEIRESEMSHISKDLSHNSGTSSVFFELIGDLVYLRTVSGFSAVDLLGRFGKNSDEIQKLIRSISESEKDIYKNAVVADIIHLPSPRLGNVTLKSQSRDYEIPFLAQSSVSKEYQIPVSDLYLKYIHKRLFLFSKSLQKAIIPRLNSAHNYSHQTLPIYQFLCDYQKLDSVPSLFFHWGQLENNFNFLPKVKYKNTILSPAIWIYRKDEIPTHVRESDQKLLEWFNEKNIPDKVFLDDGDKGLLLNLKNKFCRDIFLSTLEKENKIKLSEWLYEDKDCVVTDASCQFYKPEFIASVAFNTGSTSSVNIHKLFLSDTQLNFEIGSRWIYIKLYCNPNQNEPILSNCIKPILEKFKNNNWLKQWFFIGSYDSDYHLRFRVELNSEEDYSQALKMICDSMRSYVENKIIRKIDCERYQRELNKYGDELIEEAEAIFHIDSESVLDAISIQLFKNENDRLFFSMKGIDDLFNVFEIKFEKKRSIILILKESLKNHFGINNKSKPGLTKHYNTLKKEIFYLLDDKNFDSHFSVQALNILEKRSVLFIPVVNAIRLKLVESSQLTDFSDLLSNYIHMFCNRVFPTETNYYEYVVYDFLDKYYLSQKYCRKEQTPINI